MKKKLFIKYIEKRKQFLLNENINLFNIGEIFKYQLNCNRINELEILMINLRKGDFD